MIVTFILMMFFVFSFLRPLLLEIQRQDALLLNATLSSNTTKFLSEEWLQGGLLGNSTERKGLKDQATAVQPDWSLVLGTFHHSKDENFEEFLISAGLSFFTRAIILSTSPSVTFDRAFQGDDDYYYDLPGIEDPDTQDKEVDGRGEGDGEDERTFQMVVTTSSIMTVTQRFRLGQPFTKQDYDGTPSRNTFVFVKPNVLFHFKEKAHINTSIYNTFDQEGLVTTIISGRTGIQARRHFRREGVDG